MEAGGSDLPPSLLGEVVPDAARLHVAYGLAPALAQAYISSNVSEHVITTLNECFPTAQSVRHVMRSATDVYCCSLATQYRLVRIGASGAMRFFNLLQPGPCSPASLHCLSGVVESCISSQSMCCTDGLLLQTWYVHTHGCVRPRIVLARRSKPDMIAADGRHVCLPLFMDTKMRVLQQALSATRNLPPEHHEEAAYGWTMLYNSLIKDHDCLGALVVTTHDPLLFYGRCAIILIAARNFPMHPLSDHSATSVWSPACWHSTCRRHKTTALGCLPRQPVHQHRRSRRRSIRS